MKVSLCPVCNGRGVVSDSLKTGLPILTESQCHGCGGTGWVEVREDRLIIDLGYELTKQDHGVGWNNKCPACGGGRNSYPLTGCPKGSHYGSYCSIS